MSFKKFITKVPTRIGFATIKKDDSSDELLKIKPRIGFATIHKRDESDKLLPKKPLKEDTEPVVGPFHKEFENRFNSREYQSARIADEHEFSHHHALNKAEIEPHVEAYNKKGNDYNFAHHNEMHPIHAYTRNSYRINRHLILKHTDREQERDSTDIEHEEDTKKHIAGLSTSTHHPENALKQPTMVHSGAGVNMAPILHDTKIGEHIHMPAFTSTSTDYHTATGFRGDISHPGDNVHLHGHMMHFHLPQGYTKGRHVENVSKNRNEHEMILHRGQTFKKVDYHKEQHANAFGIPKTIHHHHFVPVEE